MRQPVRNYFGKALFLISFWLSPGMSSPKAANSITSGGSRRLTTHQKPGLIYLKHWKLASDETLKTYASNREAVAFGSLVVPVH